jgi:hypothetical protein
VAGLDAIGEFDVAGAVIKTAPYADLLQLISLSRGIRIAAWHRAV